MYEGIAPDADAFVPHPWLKSAHAQTLWPLLAPAPAPLRRERLELADGDFIDVGWCGERCVGRSIAVLVHGLGGSLDSLYVLRMARRLEEMGWRVATLQLRGAGAEPNRLPRGYHHGDTGDFRWFCQRLRRREPDARIFAVGWSLGANVVLKALGEEGGSSTIDGAVAISAPLDLELCAEHLRSTASFYQLLMLRELKRCLRAKYSCLDIPRDAALELALASQDFFGFGNAYTAPINGFRDVLDYCRRAACGPYLQSVRRPAVLLQALDDPVLGPACMAKRYPAPACVDLRLFPHGGHAGFVAAGPNGLPQLWLERNVPHVLAQLALRQAVPESPQPSPPVDRAVLASSCADGMRSIKSSIVNR